MTSNGELLRYEWSQSSGGSLTVFPDNDFLMEKITSSRPPRNPPSRPFLMPSRTPILDNNFFVHREVLAWRYLAADCKPAGGNSEMPAGPGRVRHAGTAGPDVYDRVRMELVGKEKVTIRGAERDLLRIESHGRSSSIGPFGWTTTIISN